MTIVWSAPQRGQCTGIAVAGPSIPDPSSLAIGCVLVEAGPGRGWGRGSAMDHTTLRPRPTQQTDRAVTAAPAQAPGPGRAPPPCAAAKPTAQPRIHAEAHPAGFALQPPDQDPPSMVQACAFE